MRVSAFATGIALLALAACRSTPERELRIERQSAVGIERVAPPSGSSTYQVAPGDRVEQPIPLHTVAPDYPAELLPLGLPATPLVVRVVVNAQGDVTDCLPLDPADPAALPHGTAFLAAIREATRRWHFSPLRIHRAAAAGDEGRAVAAAAGDDALPFSLDYRIEFDVVDGQPHVRTGGTTARGSH